MTIPGQCLDEAVIQWTRIGTVNSWLRDQPDAIKTAARASIREAFEPYVDGASVRLTGAVWIIRSSAA